MSGMLLINWLEKCKKCNHYEAFVTTKGSYDVLYDGDIVSCVDPACRHNGVIETDGENAWVNWDELIS